MPFLAFLGYSEIERDGNLHFGAAGHVYRRCAASVVGRKALSAEATSTFTALASEWLFREFRET